MTVGEDQQTHDFEVRMDPRVTGQVTVAQLQERFDLALRIRDRVSDANEAVLWIRDIKKALEDRQEATEDQRLEQRAQAVADALSTVEEAIYQVRNESSQDPLNFPIKLNNKLAALIGVVESADAPPTDQSYAVFDDLSAQLQRQLDRLEEIVGVDLAQLNAQLTEAGLEAVEVEKVER
jgi:hypothetical protein